MTSFDYFKPFRNVISICFDFTLEGVERHEKSKHFHFHLSLPLGIFLCVKSRLKKERLLPRENTLYFHDLFFYMPRTEYRKKARDEFHRFIKLVFIPFVFSYLAVSYKRDNHSLSGSNVQSVH